MKTELERVLSVFQQENFIGETFRLKRYEYDVSGPLLELILKQLQKAAADSELLKQIEEEENALHEVEAIQRALVKKLKQRDKELHWKDEELHRNRVRHSRVPCVGDDSEPSSRFYHPADVVFRD